MKLLRWIGHRLKHKWEHLSHPARLLDTLKEHGLALVIIIVGWEIIEDILFPLLFIWLGQNVNPWFTTGAPISWLMCLHPIVVPIAWGIWIKISRKENEQETTQD
tara:strand:- start:467 stop:781 length:315 start_codon:yes stop_codon:yes gene_type:complete